MTIDNAFSTRGYVDIAELGADIPNDMPPDTVYTRYLNQTYCELTDHLGNVRAVLGDRKLTATPGTGNYYADVRFYSHPYPFGMPQPGRTWDNALDYRYGFNGMETDPEVKEASRLHYTTYFRQYDPRLGRWWSNDPVTHPWESPYAAMYNNPIYFSDFSGAAGEGSGTGDNPLDPTPRNGCPDCPLPANEGDEHWTWSGASWIRGVYMNGAWVPMASFDLVLTPTRGYFRDHGPPPWVLARTPMTGSSGASGTDVASRLEVEHAAWLSEQYAAYHRALEAYDAGLLDWGRESGPFARLMVTGFLLFGGGETSFEISLIECEFCGLIPGLEQAQAAFDIKHNGLNFWNAVSLVPFGPLDEIGDGAKAVKRWFTSGKADEVLNFTGEAGGKVDNLTAQGNDLANPMDIRFTQPTASPNFSTGQTLTQTVTDLRSGTLKATDLPTIRVVEQNGLLFTLDNRRLIAFQHAGIENIPVVRLSLDDPLVLKEFDKKRNAINGGLNIVITPASGREAAEILLREHGKIK